MQAEILRNATLTLVSLSTVEVKNGNEGRLEDIRGRLNNAKALLGIDRKTSSTQNADLLEALLSYFELMKGSVASSSNTVLTTVESSQATPVTPVRASSIQATSDKKPRKRQIYVDSVVDDPYFICTGKGLTALVKYFAEKPKCEFCYEEYQRSRMNMSRQGHVCRLEVPCFNADSVLWLSSGVLGHPAKYVANVRLVGSLHICFISCSFTPEFQCESPFQLYMVSYTYSTVSRVP